MNVLFVCSKNKWRSPTAEKVFKNFQGISVRSAGLSDKSKRRLCAADVHWANIVFCMESKHQERIRKISREINIVNLNIPDDYQFMDPELVEILESEVTPVLEQLLALK